MTVLLACAAVVHAAGTESPAPPVVPSFSAQNYRSLIDSRTAWWTESTATYDRVTATAQIVGQYVQNPLVRRYTDGSDEVLLGDLFQADVTAALHLGRLRLGAAAPVVLAADGIAIGARPAGIGDLALDGKINLSRDGDGPLGFALSGRADLPTTSVDAPVGSGAVGWQALALVDKRAGPLLLAANLGVRGMPKVTLDNVELDDQIVYRAAVGTVLGRTSGVTLEVAGGANLRDPRSAGLPAEAMLGAWTPITGGFRLRGGIGAGLTSGIGSPDVRVLAGLSWDPNLERDRDDDGIVDRADGCPTEPEDVDERADTDGCPDPETRLTVAVRTPDGAPVPDATTTLTLPESTETGGAALEAVVPPGKYAFAASAPGFASIRGELTIPLAPELRLERVMTPIAVPLTIQLTDLDGAPLEGEWAIADGPFERAPDGQAITELLAGLYTIRARAPGFVPGEQSIRVRAKGVNVATVTLGKLVGLGSERIELNEVVQFATGSATILPASFPMLSEVALVINTHPELTRIKIEGHTDDRGNDQVNLELSTRRAAAILLYLTSEGVPVERLSSEGYGETRPLAPNSTDAGRAQNRRVEIKIESRAALEE